MTLKDDFLSDRWVEQTCAALILCNTLGLLAKHHWLFDLLSNFKPQYFVGSLILTAICLFYRQMSLAALMFVLGISLFVEIQSVNSRPFAKPPELKPNFTVVQYNKHFANHDYKTIKPWIEEQDADVVLINESLWDSIEDIKSDFKQEFPYKFPYNRLERFGDIFVLSKWPMLVTPLEMPFDDQIFYASKIVIRKNDLRQVVIYAYHAMTPVGRNDFQRRNYELGTLADIVNAQGRKTVIMMGDWNMTPYSPQFKQILKTTGLNYQNYDLFPQTTWPSFNFFGFLKIPIDQIIYSNRLDLISIKSGPASHSDHNSLVAKFHVPKDGENVRD
ncbi:MAG: hypothetical protein DI551_03590 [Micavibrio aeruginosavorus]|uniref:Endonuclease/exonuclease/phosphatase domain-containing protein n=1 Tax=Micavibrio aeruginosavorus TaxID=349221 RepID=A0A2W5N4W0_9BACT|nr:MAG: hypothetical protein DI551_03590 [Micavibrio aeruginosavorus]